MPVCSLAREEIARVQRTYSGLGRSSDRYERTHFQAAGSGIDNRGEKMSHFFRNWVSIAIKRDHVHCHSSFEGLFVLCHPCPGSERLHIYGMGRDGRLRLDDLQGDNNGTPWSVRFSVSCQGSSPST